MPIYAVNVLLSTATDMWALRYPESHQLYVLDRRQDAADPIRFAHQANSRGVASLCATRPSVVFATEPMDDDPRWSLLDAG